jgi:hypothetical protein
VPCLERKAGREDLVRYPRQRRATGQSLRPWSRRFAVTQPALMSALHELRGKDLICWCTPESCHADVLAELANPKREG